jgi:hypothetical protein
LHRFLPVRTARRLCLAVMICLPAVRVSAAPVRTRPTVRIRRVGHGWQSVVSRVDERHVIKWARSRIPESDLMPFRYERLRVVAMKRSADLVTKLRESPHFASYRHLLPGTTLARPHLIVQEVAEGLHYSALGDEAKAMADQEIRRVGEAARAAVPGEDFDLYHHGNMLFHADGRMRSWFDPAGMYGWAREWKYQQPGALESRQLIEAFNARRGTLNDGGQLFPIGHGWARRIQGGDLGNPSLAVANPASGEVFLIRNRSGFRSLYESRAPWRLSRSGEKVGEILGLPLEDETDRGELTIQRFERGRLVLDRATGEATVELAP